MRHEEEVASVLAKLLPPGGTLLDIGGNFGKVSEAVKRVRPDVQIHLFEPIQQYADKAAARLSVFSGVTVNAVGLSDAAGEAAIYMHRENPGWSTLDAQYAESGGETRSVRLMRLDDYALSACDVMKIDVGYWEGKVLKGGRRTVDRFMPFIFCEVSRGSEDLWYERVGEMERLFDIGYQRLDYRMSGRHDRLFRPKGKG